MRFAIRIRDSLTPWLVVAIGSLIVLPLVLTAGCEVACSLGAMPAGACTHGMSHDHSRAPGELLAVPAIVQPAVAAVVLATWMLALLAFSGAASPARVPGDPRRVREGTLLRI